MIVDFRLPLLGDNISSADVIKVHVKEGDKVEVDQVVVEIETDKATVEVPTDIAGIVKQVYVKEGTKAAIGEPVISVEVGGEAVKEVKSEEVRAKNEVQSEKEEVKTSNDSVLSTKDYLFTIPTLGENITSAQITKVLLKVGDKVEVDQVVLEIETDKATVEVPSEVSGVVKEVNVKDGDKVTIGSVALVIETSGKKAIENSKPVRNQSGGLRIENEKPKSETEIKPAQLSTNNSQLSTVKEHTHMPQILTLPRDIVKIVVPAAPSVRRFAREIGVEINNVRGSGPSGRISVEDVKAFAKALNQQLQQGGAVGCAVVGVPRETLPDFSKWGDIDRQPMSNIRRKTAEHLSYAWATVPHVTQFDKADITELEKIRKQFGKQVEAAGGKLTVTGILLKVIASAMKVYPQFNSSVDMEKNEIIYKKYLNIGVAVDTEKGLLVPVIKDVDKKNITQISVDLAEVSKKARDKKLGLDDMQGGCFTISNLGGIGGTYFTPIVNTPEVAILGVSKSSYEPVYIDGEFKPRLMMPLSLSYDHRIIDGADAIRFLRWVVNALENPFLMSL
ncbi:MAG: branched-chain alpha-keto acid dehydrogenase subunit E2 [Stygiobacter sp. RIFOXYC12_FULL_38_8]|nr:MAG: branched-chain alpha-keto acid dehydrogenase subunit E2 [Stygiobacter sp. RIFOXYB2_FULL_37_11]OGV11984.1 MAG: branched-chain alpha-keto acid dehydrogenase subunit E2 [Stygiobacter sp. RIFOXYA2_FULL_38_8]OGV14467.1 MAG: branched-chain alpha-keto acid dehydrogenase subunit E2 [Stygiobacter sp. RIFOXYC2_FULL_38_25]OGV27475.1 MAG: branched-chain alpha-keto acid dehydrogenase subunit E2 [Stygiobacter sp. RIFOXYC12_FULL_38_8]OGV82227.1 MAG: branched-chain alpha-keto acid dehydrogenase subunit